MTSLQSSSFLPLAPSSVDPRRLLGRERGSPRDDTFLLGRDRLAVRNARRRAQTKILGQVQRAEREPGIPVVDPPPTQYTDSFLDLAFIHACRQAFGRVAGWQSPRPWEENYVGMVEVSHALMRGRTAQQQRAAVLQGFPSVPPWFRTLFPYSDWGAQLNASITLLFFSWLVGPCRVEHAEIPASRTFQKGGSASGEASRGVKLLRSAVKIEKCRYLETSGCVGMCVNLCKVPTEYFFNNELGMPLSMEPNFENMSCTMLFGQTPLPHNADPTFSHPCLASCSKGTSSNPTCPTLL